MKIELLGHLRGLAGTKELEVALTAPTVAGLIERLSRTCGDEFAKSIVRPGNPDFKVLILVNGVDIDFLQKAMTKLVEGDRVVIIPLAAGGAPV